MGYCTALLQVGWLLNASFTVIAVYYVRYLEPQTCLAPSSSHDCPRGDGGTAWSGFAFWYAVFSFYWTSQVIRNLAHFTTAGTVSSWWLVSEIQTPTWGAFKRASTTSLGTIAVGSLLVAVIEMLNGFARYGGCICGCLCGLVRRAMRWFNRYAFIVSAMYGSEYFPAAKHISSLMGAKFWELIGHTHSHNLIHSKHTFNQPDTATEPCRGTNGRLTMVSVVFCSPFCPCSERLSDVGRVLDGQLPRRCGCCDCRRTVGVVGLR